MASLPSFQIPGRGQVYTQLSTDDKEGTNTPTTSPSSSQHNLPTSEKVQLASPRHTSHTRIHRHRLHDITITIILTLVFATILQYTFYRTIFSPNHLLHNALSSLYSEPARLNPKYHCGNSSTEALQRGCHFDLSLVGWVPAPCFSATLNQRFMDYGWRFFEDQNGTREVSIERIAESAGTREPFWAQHGFHVTHCELAWERMHLNLRGEGPRLTTHLLSLEHTMHCGMMMELRDGFDSLNSQILPLLNTC